MTETKQNQTPSFINDFFNLTKMGIIVFELITFFAGYALGFSHENPAIWSTFFISALGTALLAMGSAAFNQVQESEADKKMDRTQNRPIPSGRIKRSNAAIIAAFLLALGLFLLNQVNLSVLLLGVFAAFSYNILYTLWWKRKHAFAAIPGALPGALPILMGYQTAFHDITDPKGWYLFALLFFWQMPHFWVLALRYSSDYQEGGFPTLPVTHGGNVTRFQILLWCLAYGALGLIGALFFPLGPIGLIGNLIVTLWLFWELLRFLPEPENKAWLRFFLAVNFSLILYLLWPIIDLWSIVLHPKS